MLRAVLDANVFASSLICPLGAPGKILKQFLEKKSFELVLSKEIVKEIQRCLFYPRVRKYIKAKDEEIKQWILGLEWLADFAEGQLEENIVKKDPDDDKYLVAAFEGKAQFVVSGDSDLLEIKEYQGIQIVTPKEFLKML